MMPKCMNSAAVFSLGKRIVLGGICFFLVSLLLVGVWTIPFVFESPSILYKFGIDKAFLRTGKVLGVTAATMVFLQILLVSRFKFLDRIFSINRIYTFHRINGITIAILALLHPVSILAAENFTFFSFQMRYWPEFLGVGVLLSIVVLMITANWRLVFGFAYDKWLRFHRLGTLLVSGLMLVHILFVSETFKSGFPRLLVYLAAAINLLLVSRLWYRRLFPGHPGKKPFVVFNIDPVGKDAYAVDVRSEDGKGFSYIPGQFAFITPVSAKLPREEHPFTISSSPSRPDALQFVVRSDGDWTSKFDLLKAGEPVFIDGPYGLFSHLVTPGNDPIIMIAGGIGITPMLSMLRYMSDLDDQRQILLIWSNRTKEYIVFPEEFKNLKHDLPHLQIIHNFTRELGECGERGRLDRTKLLRLLEGYNRKSKVFICGPYEMMKEIHRALKKIGFSSSRVYKEEFKL